MYKVENEKKELLNLFLEKFPVEKVLTRILLENPDKSDIYVDNKEKPKFCLGIYNKKEFVLMGDIENQEIILELEELMKEYQLGLGSIYNKNLLDKLVKDSSILNDFDERIHFKFDQNCFKESDLKLEGFELKEIDEELADRIPQEIDLDFSEAWESGKSFVDNGGFGYVLLKDNVIVATAWSYFLSSQGVEIAVATGDELRNKGLGQYVAGKMIKKTLEKGLEPHWACHKKNIPSEKLGLKLGFEFHLDYFWLYPNI